MTHELRTVAQSQHRNAKLKQFFAAGSSSFLIHTIRAAGQDNALWIHFFDLFDISLVRINLTINIAFTHAAGNQLDRRSRLQQSSLCSRVFLPIFCDKTEISQYYLDISHVIIPKISTLYKWVPQNWQNPQPLLFHTCFSVQKFLFPS